MTEYPPEWRRLLELLESSQEGSTKAALVAHSFSSATIAELVDRGLVSVTIERKWAGQRTVLVRQFKITDRGRATLGPISTAIDPFVLKMALRKAHGGIKGLRRHIGEADEDVIVLKLLAELDVARLRDYQEAGRCCGFHIRYA